MNELLQQAAQLLRESRRQHYPDCELNYGPCNCGASAWNERVRALLERMAETLNPSEGRGEENSLGSSPGDGRKTEPGNGL